MDYSLVFRNATVLDGTGARRYVADVGVVGDHIAAIGDLHEASAEKTVSASGLFLCPGFIDMHAHSELEVLRDPSMSAKVNQGITTEVSGNCGIGVYPAREDDGTVKVLTRDVLGGWDGHYWLDFSAYRNTLEEKGCGTNMAFLVSHSALRCAAMEGNPNREATDGEIRKMCDLLSLCLEEGCVGFSSGLYYAPCLYASHRELSALLLTTRFHGGFFAVHHRCEGDDVLSSLEEVLDLARETGVRLEVSHLKALGPQNQHKVKRMLAMLEDARREGVDVHFDQYPYTYGSTSLFSLLPPSDLKLSKADLQIELKDPVVRTRIRGMMERPEGWDSIYETAGWEQITILVLESHPEYEMMTVSEIARQRGQDPFDTFFDLLAEEQGTALMADVTQSEKSLVEIMRHPLMCFGTDALYAGSLCHPRSFNAAVHLLDVYGRQHKVLSWEDLIRRMTGETARRLRLSDRGIIAVGKKADLVLFDPERIRDTSTMQTPQAVPEGLRQVYVNGVLASEEGVATGSVAGKILA